MATLFTIIFFHLLIFSIVSPVFSSSSCSAYTKTASNCEQSKCARCFNAGARSGKICQGSSTGYYCPADVQSGSDINYACMDWTFGSNAMRAQEEAFKRRTNENVYFGVGTYGTYTDPQRGLGSCFRLKVEGVDRDLLVQSVNTGSDVSGNQFDLQVGCGGAGAFNICAGGSSASMFAGDYSSWGHVYGGVDTREQCAKLPRYPKDSAAMISAGDSLVALCEYSFDKKVRLNGNTGNSNPTILSVDRVKCPDELVYMTQIQRNDDPSYYRKSGGQLNSVKCGQNGGLEWCLTRMMDCRKPSGSWPDNVRSWVMVDGKKLVQPCTADGYTRMDNQCGCFDCYC